MLAIGEPPRTQFDLNFSISGIPVRVSPWFWLVGVLLGANSGDGMMLLIWIAVLFVSILIHELGHAVVMRRFGESPRIVLYMLGGLAISGGDSPWQSAPSRPRNSVEQIIISAAGPAAGFAFAAFIMAVLVVTGGNVSFRPALPFWSVTLPSNGVTTPNLYLIHTVHALLWVNILWGLVNLLPVYPLDGGQISRELFVQQDPWRGIRNSLMLSMITGIAVAVGALMWLGEPFIAIMFGLLAFSSWQTLQQMSGGGGRFGGPWSGGRPW